jgi:trk system potassium uptake protein
MRIVICGAGQVGYGIAERLAAEGHEISVVDVSQRLIGGIRDTLDVRGVVGHGSHPDVLANAGAAEADMLIAVTQADEVNMTACQVAHTLFEVPTKIARVRAQSYLAPHYQHLFARDQLPIDVVISPEIEVGEMVLRRLALPGAVETVRFADDHVVVIGILCHEDCPVVDTPLRQLTELFPDLGAVVTGVFREGRLFVPRSDDSLLVGDLVYVVAQREQVRRTLAIFGHEEPKANRVVIAGGGNIGFYVAQQLEAREPATKIKIIEQSRDRAMHIADELKRTVILNGSALDQDILREADVEDGRHACRADQRRSGQPLDLRAGQTARLPLQPLPYQLGKLLRHDPFPRHRCPGQSAGDHRQPRPPARQAGPHPRRPLDP